MKKLNYVLLLTGFLLVVQSVSAQNHWQRSKGISGAACYDMITLTNGHTLLLTTDGVYASTDSTNSWIKRSEDLDSLLSNSSVSELHPDILFLNQDSIFLFLNKKLFLSTDEGYQWHEINLSSLNLQWGDMLTINGSDLYFCQTDQLSGLSSIYYSQNGGIDWQLSDTLTAKLSLSKLNNEVYVWGYTGSIWGSKSPVLKKLSQDGKLLVVNTFGLPTDADIRGMSIAGNNNLVVMIPEYNSNQAISATRLYAYNGSQWQFGTQFTPNYTKLYHANGYCFHPFFAKNYLLRSNDGINWVQVNTGITYDTYSSIRSIGNRLFTLSPKRGVYETDIDLRGTARNKGLYARPISSVAVFKDKVIAAAYDGEIFISDDMAQSFNMIAGFSEERNAANLSMSNQSIYRYNKYLSADEKIFVSINGNTLDSLIMPLSKYTQRQVLAVSKIGLLMQITDSNFTKHFYFYKDQDQSWIDLSPGMPVGLMQFEAASGANGDLFAFANFWNSSGVVYSLFRLDSNLTWTEIKHDISNLWYQNTNTYNGTFYFLKNQHQHPDTLYRVKNDSLVFESTIQYGNFQFYTNSDWAGTNFHYRGKDIYSLGFDSLKMDIHIIASNDSGQTWIAFNEGMALNTNVYALDFSDSMIYAASSNGLYVYGNSIINGIKTKEKSSSLYNLYPNPASSDYVTLGTNLNGEYSVKLRDLNGRILLLQNSSEKVLQIPVENLQNGMYLLQITNGSYTEYKKLLINK